MASIILSIIAIVISILTLLFHLFQEYRELFTIYWFAEYDVVYIPIDCEKTSKPTEFIDAFQNEFRRNLDICEFKKQWVGNLNTIYYQQSSQEYINKIDDLPLKSYFQFPAEHTYFKRVIITHKGKKSFKRRIKSIKKAV